jgi:hypothetical protein
MTRKTLKIGFADTFGTAINFFTHVLGQRYNIQRDDENPDYLIFGDGNFGQSHRRFDKYKVKKIFYTGENVRPNYDECSFAMTFDHENSNRHYRLPLYVLDMYCAVFEGWTDDVLQIKNVRRDYEKDYDRRKFCSFVVSNPRQEIRNAMFHLMCEYKTVDSGGPTFNNIGRILPRDKLHYKVDFLDDYRFNICFENGSYPGYVTEKILNAFQAKTLPIYWGSKTVNRDFNTKSFINAFNFNHLQEIVSYVSFLNSPDGKKEYLDIIEQPVFNNNVPNEFTNVNNLLEWWDTFVVGEE